VVTDASSGDEVALIAPAMELKLRNVSIGALFSGEGRPLHIGVGPDCEGSSEELLTPFLDRGIVPGLWEVQIDAQAVTLPDLGQLLIPRAIRELRVERFRNNRQVADRVKQIVP